METTENELTDRLISTKITTENILDTEIDECEEAVTTDSEDYQTEPNRYQNISQSSSSEMSTVTLTPQSDDFMSICNGSFNLNNIEVPIVGYEVMEKRGRFTVYKLRIENKASGDCWYVFRRYTDFVRLCNRLKHAYPHITQHLPRKRIIGNNYDPVFLEERVSGLQTLVNAILTEQELANSSQIQDFFCLNEPPVYSETNEESRAMFEALEDTIYQLRQQIQEKESLIDKLENNLRVKSIENENLRKVIDTSSMNCQKCQKDIENITKMKK